MRRSQNQDSEQIEEKLLPCEACLKKIPIQSYDQHLSRCKDRESNKSKTNLSFIGIGASIKDSKIYMKRLIEKKKEEEPIEKIPCTNCGYMMTLEQLDTHPSKCIVQEGKCQFCNQEFPSDLMQQHYAVCEVKIAQQPEESQEQDPEQIRNNYQHAINRLNELMQLLNLLGVNQNQGLSQKQRGQLKVELYKKSNPEGDLCTVCFCDIQEKQEVIRLQCKHLYHPDCIKKWLQEHSSCPNCKKDIKKQKK